MGSVIFIIAAIVIVFHIVKKVIENIGV